MTVETASALRSLRTQTLVGTVSLGHGATHWAVAVDVIHEMGGLTYLPHPLDRRRANFRPERVLHLARRIDIIETYNPWCEAGANAAAARLAAELGKVTASGSDAHGIQELGRSWMEIEEYEDPADFLDKLRDARHVVTASSGTGRRA